MRRRVIAGILGVAIVVACSGKQPEQAKPALTERQRDSTIAESKLPGAGVVGKALEQSDSARARASDTEN